MRGEIGARDLRYLKKRKGREVKAGGEFTRVPKSTSPIQSTGTSFSNLATNVSSAIPTNHSMTRALKEKFCPCFRLFYRITWSRRSLISRPMTSLSAHHKTKLNVLH
jgi:hypothetical protein